MPAESPRPVSRSVTAIVIKNSAIDGHICFIRMCEICAAAKRPGATCVYVLFTKRINRKTSYKEQR